MNENLKKIMFDSLVELCRESLKKNGMTEEHADTVSRTLAKTDLMGIHSHGTKNLHAYIEKIHAGGINLNVSPEIIKEGPAFALLDGHDIIGMVSANRAMEMAIGKAGTCGISCVAVRNGCHFGAAGYYSNMAAERGMIGIAMSNVDANMAIIGAKGHVIGNNPFSYAAPCGDSSVFLDIAMSSVASLKVIQAKKDKQSIPDSWITDGEGNPTTDPSRYPDEGAMQPMAGHKGYGLALMVEILTGVISGGGMTTDIPSWLFSLDTKNNVSYTFIVIDASKFISPRDFKARMNILSERLHNSRKATGSKRIYCPGEMEWDKAREAEKKGILLPFDVVESLEKLSRDSGVPVNWKTDV